MQQARDWKANALGGVVRGRSGIRENRALGEHLLDELEAKGWTLIPLSDHERFYSEDE